MQFCKFVIDDEPWCMWDFDTQKINTRFLKNIDPKYFDYLADLYIDSCNKEDEDSGDKTCQYAAVALRAAYSQALETFFAFLFAGLQAPHCAIGWIHKYQIKQLKSLIRKVNSRAFFYSGFDISPISWKIITNISLSFKLEDKNKEESIKNEFSILWQRFAEDMLNEKFHSEYNSIKHGLRLKHGGVWLAMGIETTPGVPAPPENMHLLGKEDLGSTFYEPQKIQIKAADNTEKNFRMIKHSKNWRLEKFYCGLKLLSMSIQNLISFHKIMNGINPESVEFSWPDKMNIFNLPWSTHPSIAGFSMNNIITPELITPFTKQEILEVYLENND